MKWKLFHFLVKLSNFFWHKKQKLTCFAKLDNFHPRSGVQNFEMFSNETKRLCDHRTLTWNSYIYCSWEQTTFLTLRAFQIRRTYNKHITYSSPWKSPLNFTSQYAFALLNFIFPMGSETKTNERRRKVWLWNNQPQPSNLMPQMLMDFIEGKFFIGAQDYG